MGIFGALTTSVTGLRAQAYALENISGNIANSQTPGFKRVDTSFADIIGDSPANQQSSGAVSTFSRGTNSVSGNVQNSSIDTYMAINGDGFFTVQRPVGFTDGNPIFDGIDLFTRRGDFELNDQGYLVNGTGYYLKSFEVDPNTGNVLGSTPTAIQFNNNFLPAQVTTEISYRANLPSYPLTQTSDSAVADSELIDPTSFASNPTVTASAPSQLVGSGASLSADASATLTGTTDISALASVGGTLVINGQNITINPGDNAAAVEAAIDGATGTSGVTAAIVGNNLELTSINADTNIQIGAGSTPALLAELGITAGTTNATNLLTQSAANAGETLIVTVGSNPPETITFGTGAGQVSTLAELDAALGALGNVTGSVNLANGNITLTGPNTVDPVVVTGTFTAANFGLTTLTAVPTNGTITANDNSTFLNQSLSGGAITVFDTTGAPINVQLRWAKTDTSLTGGSDTWNLFYLEDANATATDVQWRNVGIDYTFSANGTLNPAQPIVAINNLTVNGTNVGNVNLNHGTTGLTQFADPDGSVQVNEISQNGSSAGQLQDITIADGGVVSASYSNGRTSDLAQIPLVSFFATNNLKRVDGGAFEPTEASGDPLAQASGTIVGGALEESNTDISEEFTKLIVTQQAYAANTRVVTTAEAMLQETLNIIR